MVLHGHVMSAVVPHNCDATTATLYSCDATTTTPHDHKVSAITLHDCDASAVTPHNYSMSTVTLHDHDATATSVSAIYYCCASALCDWWYWQSVAYVELLYIYNNENIFIKSYWL